MEVQLSVKNLKKHFDIKGGKLHAVDDVSFDIISGETLGIVGESGCGKSTLGRVILRLLEATSGEIIFEGNNILEYKKKELKKLRTDMQIIFQDPYSSLDPRMTVSEIIGEPLKVNKIFKNKRDILQKAYEAMDIVGLSRKYINIYPHELDGGRRQRIGIARALILQPKFIVCDEPVSALDVSIQAQILNLMMDLQKEFNLTYMFITHDLSVVKHISDEIGVMYLGKMVEKAKSEEMFKNPLHPYTKALLSAIPRANLKYRDMNREVLKGEITSPVNPKPGCRFVARCNYSMEICHLEDPILQEIENRHYVSCHLFNK